MLAGYLGKAASVLIDAGSDGEVTFTLVKPATLVVTGEPADAIVMLDSMSLGALPVRKEGLKPGSYRLGVTRDSYMALQDTLTLQEGVADSLHVVLVAEASAAVAVPVAAPVSAPRSQRGRLISALAAIATFVVLGTVMVAVDLASD
jgi:hypothetical protein